MHTDFCGFLHVRYVSTDVHFKKSSRIYMAQNICVHQMSCFMLTCLRLARRSVSLFHSIYFCQTAEPCRTDGSVGMKNFGSQSDPYPLMTSHTSFPALFESVRQMTTPAGTKRNKRSALSAKLHFSQAQTIIEEMFFVCKLGMTFSLSTFSVSNLWRANCLVSRNVICLKDTRTKQIFVIHMM